MIVCQHENKPYQFTVILEDEIVWNAHGRTEKQLFDDVVWNVRDPNAGNEHKLADVIMTGLLAGA